MLPFRTPEQRLVERLQEGDKVAAREFYVLYADTLAGVCACYIADEDDLKDVFQDAFIQILTHIGDFRYRGAGSLLAWAKKVVVNQALKFLRTAQRLDMVPLDRDFADTSKDEEPSVADLPPEILRQLVSRLPTGYRTVLNLYVFEGKSHQEIARLLDIKESSSASQLHRAKHLLAKMIRTYHDENKKR